MLPRCQAVFWACILTTAAVDEILETVADAAVATATSD